ncbi:Kelch repeat-containing protein [Sorangium sp. So ce131]|uniref:Kelch repeat-containing protein n=1 Tax=Sorangium sp. So ce131 TaxID=3133282 RepID=UPI003F63A797
MPFDCGPYRCSPALGACLSRCHSVDDCAPGSVCNADGHCVPPPDRAHGQDAGCNLTAQVPGRPGAAWLAAGLLAFEAARRRRQASPRLPRLDRGRESRCGLLLCLSLVASCAAEPGSPGAAALRDRFPDQAAEILERRDALVAVAEGFAVQSTSRGTAAWQRRGDLRAVLPRRGEDVFRFRLAHSSGSDRGAALSADFEVRVRELGASGEGAVAGSAVAYARPGGTSYWTATESGYEEWLLLEEGFATGDRPSAAWEIEGAALRQGGRSIELCDEGGTPRLRVTAPRAYAEGGRPIEARLAVNGKRIELWVDAGDQRALVDPAWIAAGSMGAARYAGQTATLLGDGRVLVAGGIGADGSDELVLNSAELFDPKGNTWVPAAALGGLRTNHTATLLGNGFVRVAGGVGFDGVQNLFPQLYDPNNDTWTGAAGSFWGRDHHTATLLGNGKVLVAGGLGSDPEVGTTAELYDPDSDTETLTGSMNASHAGHTATLLGNGKVLIVGGSATSQASAELYDPDSDTWSVTGPMGVADRSGHTATLLGDGRTLVAGGANLSAAELYDPVSSTWTPAASMGAARSRHTATLLSNGQVLIAGGLLVPGDQTSYLASAELYDPARDTWAPTASMTTGRYDHTATRLGSGQVLIAGGKNDNVLASAELFSPLPTGAPCTLPGECQTGFCVDGVCCTTACEAGPCNACSAAAGAPWTAPARRSLVPLAMTTTPAPRPTPARRAPASAAPPSSALHRMPVTTACASPGPAAAPSS